MAWFIRMLGSHDLSKGETKATVQDCSPRYPKQCPERALEITMNGITALEKRVILSRTDKKLLKVLKQQRQKYIKLVKKK